MSQPNNNNEEGIVAHILRVCKNSCTKCFGVVQTTDEYAKIKYKEYQIENRKKQFGLDYFDLVSNPNTTDAEKQACIDAVLHDTANVTNEINILKQEIERVNQTTQEKIVNKPGTPAAAAVTTATTATATTVPTAAVTTTTTAAAPPTTTTISTKTPEAPTSPVVPEVSTGVEVTPTVIPSDVQNDPTMTDIPLTTTTTTN